MSRTSRLLILDGLRGMMLVVIAVNHYGGPLSDYRLDEPLGFVSAAEGFIFLAGLMLGLLYLRKLADDPRALTLKLLGRAFKIYSYHLGVVLTLLGVAGLVPFYAAQWGTWLGDYASTPWLSLGATLTLLYRPEYLDILPLYATFFCFAPLVLWAFARGHAWPTLGVSVLLYLLAPLGLADLYWNLLPSAAHLDRGYFNPFSWQLLFVLGIYLGGRWRQGTLALPFRRRYVLGAALFVALALLGRELQRFDLLGDFYLVKVLFTRTYLSPLRLLNFFLLVYLLVALLQVRPKGWRWLEKPVRRTLEHPWLVLLGRHSLYVFAFHLVALYLLSPFRGDLNETLESLLFVASLALPALAHQAWQTRQLAPRSAPQT